MRIIVAVGRAVFVSLALCVAVLATCTVGLAAGGGPTTGAVVSIEADPARAAAARSARDGVRHPACPPGRECTVCVAGCANGPIIEARRLPAPGPTADLVVYEPHPASIIRCSENGSCRATGCHPERRRSCGGWHYDNLERPRRHWGYYWYR